MEEAPRFAADRMLGRLARWLRLLGADVSWYPDLGGSEFLRRARAEERIALTRDKRLRTAPDVEFLSSDGFRGQLREVLARFPFDPQRHAFSRCSRCNKELTPIEREDVRSLVPPFVYANHQRFARCEQCGRIYWQATHPERILGELRRLGLGW